MSSIRFALIGKPSHSKGWGRYAVTGPAGERVVQSSTGNEWVSAAHAAEAEDGAALTLRAQVMLRIGKARPAREEITLETFRLVAAPGETCEVEHRPGSQGVRIRIEGARLA